MYVFSQFIPRSRELIEKREVLQDRIKLFYQENYTSFEGRSTNISNNIERNRLLANFLESILAA
jgi:hypothetical protein